MIEVLFTESAAGSMQLAKSAKNIIGSSTSVFICHADGCESTSEELLCERTRVEEEYQNKRNNAIEMEETSEDVLCFPLNLSIAFPLIYLPSRCHDIRCLTNKHPVHFLDSCDILQSIDETLLLFLPPLPDVKIKKFRLIRLAQISIVSNSYHDVFY